MFSRGTWLRVVGEAGVCRRGASTGVHHLPSHFLAVGGGVRGRRILLEGSVAVLPPPASLRVETFSRKRRRFALHLLRVKT